MKSNVFTCEILFDEPLNKVFSFFTQAENLELITPPFLSFQVMTPDPIEMKPGTLLDYTLKMKGFPSGGKQELISGMPQKVLKKSKCSVLSASGFISMSSPAREIRPS